MNKLEKEEMKNKNTTSKKLVYFLIGNCIVIEIYAMVAMLYLKDLSALSLLITTIIGQSVSYGIYCLKSFFSKKEEEQLKFEKERFITEFDSLNGNVEDEGGEL